MTAPIIAGAEPWSADGGPHGALCLHGFTGNCNSLRGLAEAFHSGGYAVELPLLPGHGTALEDMMETGWDDWVGAAEDAYQRLADRTDKVVVAGLSMGGALTAWLAARHPEIAGIVCINALVQVPEGMEEMVNGLIAAGETTIAGIGSDIADPESHESGYAATPLKPLATLFGAADDLGGLLAQIACPVLILSSPQDHVVEPVNSDTLAAAVSGPAERITLERSYHVATLDYDKDLIEQAAVEFAAKVTSG